MNPKQSAEVVLGETTAVRPSLAVISPTPTDEEVVAIVAALELAWPRLAVGPRAAGIPEPAGAWKWSGRWWASSPTSRRRTW